MPTPNQQESKIATNKVVVKTVKAQATQPEASQLSETHSIGGKPFSSTRIPLLLYWLICLVVGGAVLHEAIFSWHIPAAWSQARLFLILAIIVTIASQVAYWLVARSDGRPFLPVRSIIFVIINGIVECWMFLAAYQLLFSGAKLIFGSLDWINVAFGIVGFIFYSGFIHGFFWARLLPPHFTAEPRWQPLRHRMVPIQAAIVVSWCLYFFATGDIWTLVALHALMDAILVTRIHPPIFQPNKI